MNLDNNGRNIDHKEALIAKESIEKEIKNTRNELELLDKTLLQTSHTFYKELCEEDDDRIDNGNHYENIYVDVLNQWKHDIHDIEVHIVQFHQWLQNEKQQGFKAKFMNDQEVYKPIKRLQSGRNRSAIITIDDVRSPWCYNTRSSTCCIDVLKHVKTNRTLQLRKANTEKKKKEQYKDPYYIPPLKRKYKKLDNYTKEDVYNRLTETTTIAYDQRQRLKPVIKSKQTNPSLMTLWSKTGSLTSNRRVTFSAKQQNRPDTTQQNRPDTTQQQKRPDTTQYSAKQQNSPDTTQYRAKPTESLQYSTKPADKGTRQYNTTIQPLKVTRLKSSKIPRPVSTLHPRLRDVTNNNWTEKQNRLSNNDKSQTVSENTKNKITNSTNKSTNMSENVDGVESGKASSASTKHLETWQDLSKMFPPKSEETDEFLDIKSSYVGAQKIYGIPAKKGKFINFLKRNIASSKKNIKNKKEDQKMIKKVDKVKLKKQPERESVESDTHNSVVTHEGAVANTHTIVNITQNKEVKPGTYNKLNTTKPKDNTIKPELDKQNKTHKQLKPELDKQNKTHKQPKYKLATSLFSKSRNKTKPDQHMKSEENTGSIKDMSSKYAVLPSISASKNDDTTVDDGNGQSLLLSPKNADITIEDINSQSELTYNNEQLQESCKNVMKGTDNVKSTPTVSTDQLQINEQSLEDTEDTNQKIPQLAVIKRLLMQKPKSAHLATTDKTKCPTKPNSKQGVKSTNIKEDIVNGKNSPKEDIIKVRKSKSDHSHIVNCASDHKPSSQTSQKSTTLKLLRRKLHFNYRKKTAAKDGNNNTSEKTSDKKRNIQRNMKKTSPSDRKKQNDVKSLSGVSKSAGSSSQPTSDQVGLVNSDSATTRWNKTNIQTNTFEELNLKPTEQHVFTKFSDDLSEKAKLAKLDERFLQQKARVENSVKKNHIEVLSDDDVQYDDDDDYSEDDEEKPRALKQQTLLLKKRIDQRKKAMMCKSQDNWPYCNIPGFVDTVINTE